MVDITKLPLQELLNDREASLADIQICERALALGIEAYGTGKSTEDRLIVNQGIVATIDAELQRRGIAI